MGRTVLLFAMEGAMIAALILVPAYIFTVYEAWQPWVATALYVVFFSAVVMRGAQHGKFAKRKDDRQFQSGRYFFLVQVFGLLGVHWLAPFELSRSTSFPTPVHRAFGVIGVVLMVLGIVMNRSAIGTLGKFFDKLTIKDDHRLVKEGIYAKVRHPIYGSYILCFSGYVCLMLAPLSALLLVVTCLLWYGNRIPIEETMMLGKFGDDYRTYMAQTKRLFPYVY
jgi:protein-S-isoprenylcysteine O-methyltransferase Ste14